MRLAIFQSISELQCYKLKKNIIPVKYVIFSHFTDLSFTQYSLILHLHDRGGIIPGNWTHLHIQTALNHCILYFECCYISMTSTWFGITLCTMQLSTVLKCAYLHVSRHLCS